MFEKEISIALIACEEANKAILDVYSGEFAVEIKEDNSPVTVADKRSNEIILNYLREAFPEDGFLSEESEDDSSRLEKHRVWIIDPLDGTKEFVARNGEFAVNIALSIDGEIVLGVIGAPTLDRVYYAIKGQGAFVVENGERKEIHVSSRRKGELIPYCSRSFRNKDALEFTLRHPEIFACPCIPLGSSLKMAFIAEGRGDYFLRLYPGTKEWDVASGDIILREAGGIMLNGEDYAPFRYNRKDVYNHKGYILSKGKSYTYKDLVGSEEFNL